MEKLTISHNIKLKLHPTYFDNTCQYKVREFTVNTFYKPMNLT